MIKFIIYRITRLLQATVLVSLIVLIDFTSLYAQIDFSKVVLEFSHVRDNIYVFRQGLMAYSNTCILKGNDGILPVDAGHGPLSEKLLYKIHDRIGPGEVKYVLNTHWHGDHIGDNEYFGALATIISHKNLNERLANQPVLEIRGGTTKLIPVGISDSTFSDSILINFSGEKVHMFHVPNPHTDDDGVIHFKKANEACIGDLFQRGLFPNIDSDNGGNLSNFMDQVNELIQTFSEDIFIIWNTERFDLSATIEIGTV